MSPLKSGSASGDALRGERKESGRADAHAVDCTRARYWVVAYGLVILVLISMQLFLVRQSTFRDTGGFLNPPYEFVHQGRVVYPAYGHDQADQMVIHPPPYSWTAGALMKVGLSYFRALALIVFVGAAVAIIAILASGLPPLRKLAFITALYVTNFQFVDPFLARPELALTVWWLAGLFILESARIRNWPGKLLALGSFTTAYGCSLHYHAWPGVGAIGIYALILAIDLGPRKAFPKLTWLLSGFTAYLIPFVGYFLAPHWTAIASVIHSVNATRYLEPSGMLAALSAHIDAYHHYKDHALLAGKISPLCFVFYPVLAVGIPSVLLALPVLATRRDTRVIALASAPLLLPMLFIIVRKFPELYFRPEYTLFLTAFLIIVILGFTTVLGRATRSPAIAYTPAMVILAVAVCVAPDRDLWLAFNGHGFIDEIRLERAAAKEIIGPRAVVGGPFVLPWFTGGGAIYRDLSRQLIFTPDISSVDAKSLFREMDAVVDTPYFSGVTYNKQRKSLTSFYVDGVLSLRGIYSGRVIRGIQEGLLLLSAHATRDIKAFYWHADEFYEFRSAPGGDSELLVVQVPTGATLRQFPEGTEVILTLSLPARREGAPNPKLVVMLGHASTLDNFGEICRGCSTRDRVRGKVAARDPGPMIRDISYQEEIVKFY